MGNKIFFYVTKIKYKMYRGKICSGQRWVRLHGTARRDLFRTALSHTVRNIKTCSVQHGHYRRCIRSNFRGSALVFHKSLFSGSASVHFSVQETWWVLGFPVTSLSLDWQAKWFSGCGFCQASTALLKRMLFKGDFHKIFTFILRCFNNWERIKNLAGLLKIVC